MRTEFAVPESEEDQVRELHKILSHGSAALIGPTGDRLELPDSVYLVLKAAVNAMQNGKAVSIIPENKEMTTQEAADYMGVSRPHVVKLVESKQLPSHKVGSHRRIYLSDLRDFVKQRDADRHAILDQLAKEASSAGLYQEAKIPEDGSDG